MIYFLYACIIFIATFLGACTGLGGGVIIKPALDFIGAHDIQTISILSSCAVFTMAIYSTIKQIKNKVQFDFILIILISMGAMLGGIIGNTIFDYLLNIFNSNTLSIIQAICLIILLIIVLINVNTKHHHFKIKNKCLIFIVGLSLGLLSSFLSIGGGPINVAVFSYFFSFDMKLSAIYSIATILFSQSSKLFTIFMNHGFIGFDFTLLYVLPMAIFGGIVGTKVNRIVSENTIKTIFNFTVIGIILLNVYNLITFIQ